MARVGLWCHRLSCQSQSLPSQRDPPFPEGFPLPSLALRPSCPQGKGWYRARHNETGQEGLLAASALRERGAIRADPKLSLMP